MSADLLSPAELLREPGRLEQLHEAALACEACLSNFQCFMPKPGKAGSVMVAKYVNAGFVDVLTSPPNPPGPLSLCNLHHWYHAYMALFEYAYTFGDVFAGQDLVDLCGRQATSFHKLAVFLSEEVLSAFARACGRIAIDDIAPESFQDWCQELHDASLKTLRKELETAGNAKAFVSTTDFENLRLGLEIEYEHALRRMNPGKSNQAESIDRPDLLTDAQQQVYEIIRDFGPILGKQITTRTGIEQNVLTTHIIPKLKAKRGVANLGAGYFLPTD